MSTSMRPVQVLLAAAATAAGLLAMAWASAAPMPLYAGDDAGLRLSWSARPERIEKCRAVTEAEQARREEHMRQRVECEGGFATYRLAVEVDGHSAGESVVRGAGLRHDRPLYLLRDYPIAPGTHRIRVILSRREATDDDAAAFAPTAVPEADTGLYAGRAQREAAERVRRARAAIPSRLSLDTTVSFAPRRVMLVTFNAERRILELHSKDARP